MDGRSLLFDSLMQRPRQNEVPYLNPRFSAVIHICPNPKPNWTLKVFAYTGSMIARHPNKPAVPGPVSNVSSIVVI